MDLIKKDSNGVDTIALEDIEKMFEDMEKYQNHLINALKIYSDPKNWDEGGTWKGGDCAPHLLAKKALEGESYEEMVKE